MREAGCRASASKLLFLPRSKKQFERHNLKIIFARVIRDSEKLRRVCGITVRVLEPKDIGEWRYPLFMWFTKTKTKTKRKRKTKTKTKTKVGGSSGHHKQMKMLFCHSAIW